MKKLFILLALAVCMVSCSKKEETKGTITFGANAETINTPQFNLKIEIFIDDELIGEITKSSTSVEACGLEGNVTKELTTGSHVYKYHIQSVYVNPGEYQGLEKTYSETVTIEENVCTKIFIDLPEIGLND